MTESREHRVVFSIEDELFPVGPGSDEVIKGFSFPNGSSVIWKFVDLMGGVRFPGMENAGKRKFSSWANYHMDMIGHDAPGA
jgi:hypothetical protein